ncbi:DUF5060 domain-containing protein [Novipirellula artificiosorum]|uniref:Putative endoglucanase n=1 Tax=Novipirellula artificiosorum TaxID=2528016 RepID=A0A5C6DWQ2_9BACT|nr:DUF5060 domain-containing protein [Novipirellula artificiosorum]TWU41078.1 putative endoglucanase [Novipirellula artificiosorum]
MVKATNNTIVPLVILVNAILGGIGSAQTHVFEVVEKTFTAENTYHNPYIDVDLWVNLNGPNGKKHLVPAFWDGGQTFRVRLVATMPGAWNWSTGTTTGDSGLDRQRGSFDAIAWTDSEKEANPNRRGFIRATASGHHAEYADGTPFLMAADTVWSGLTKIFKSGSDEGIAQISFQNYLDARKAQGYNAFNMIACYPTDTTAPIWHAAVRGQKVSDRGHTPFVMDGVNADLTRIVPEYWQEADPKMKYMADNGFVPFLETVRRSESWPKLGQEQKDAFYNYVRYLWARYGCYNMVFSWVHMDADGNGEYDLWLPVVKHAYDELKRKNGTGSMPYGTPRTAMAAGTSLDSWSKDARYLLDFHNISNSGARSPASFAWMRALYADTPHLPAQNVEGFYPGWNRCSAPFTPSMTLGQSAIYGAYGNVLNGAFAGYSWGDLYFSGAANGDDPNIPNGTPQKFALSSYDSFAFGYMPKFFLDAGHDFSKLSPDTNKNLGRVSPLITLAIATDQSYALGFICPGVDTTTLKNLTPSTDYRFEWWQTTTGTWQAATVITTDVNGSVAMPSRPDSTLNWAFRIQQSNENP